MRQKDVSVGRLLRGEIPWPSFSATAEAVAWLRQQLQQDEKFPVPCPICSALAVNDASDPTAADEVPVAYLRMAKGQGLWLGCWRCGLQAHFRQPRSKEWLLHQLLSLLCAGDAR